MLTTREFAPLAAAREGIDLKEHGTFGVRRSLYERILRCAGAIFGTTGGVMEAAVRTIYSVVNGKELERPSSWSNCAASKGCAAATVDLGGPFGEVKVAMVHGLGDTRALVEKVIWQARTDFDFIEVMACPGGCVDGGGSLRSKKSYLPLAMARRDTIYTVDRKANVRQSHNNEQVKTLYRDFLEAPNSEKAHELLHTEYTDRRRALQQTVKDVWDEITMSTVVY